MRSEPSSTISSNERANRKSPTNTAGLLPQTALAVSRPRRRSLESTTSSCSSVAVWMNSTAAASAICRSQPLAAGRDDMPGQLRDQRHRAVHALDDQRVDPVEIVGNQAKQRVERGL